MATARITVEELHHRHGDTETLAGLDFGVEPGRVLAVVGPSGCGKSTLLGLIAGLGDPTEGMLRVAGGEAATARLAACALMPQQDLLLPWYDALDNASLALRNRGIGRADARAEAAASFRRFGLAGFESKLPNQLSGGMRQRVAFLRTLLAGKPVLLLDEPFASLDAITRAGMQAWLAEALAAEPRTTVIVTHDVEEALLLADQVVILSARPARLVGSLFPPARRSKEPAEALADPALIELRKEAMAILAEWQLQPERSRPASPQRRQPTEAGR